MNYREWIYNEEIGLYYYRGEGIGRTWAEVEEIEGMIDSFEFICCERYPKP